MFCTNCGKKMPDGSRFCGACGERLIAAVPEIPTDRKMPNVTAMPEITELPYVPEVSEIVEATETMYLEIPDEPEAPEIADDLQFTEEPISFLELPDEPQPSEAFDIPDLSQLSTGYETVKVNVTAKEAVLPEPERPDIPDTAPAPFSPSPVMTVPAMPVIPVKTTAVQFRKRPNIKKLVALAAAVLVIAAVLFGVTRLFSGSGSDAAYVYISDGDYCLLTDLEQDSHIEISSTKTEFRDGSLYNGNLVSFTSDGKYVYYYTKVNHDEQTGSLCRAEYGKLKEDAGKNEKYIQIIGTNVSLGFRLRNDGTALYLGADRTLYYFDGEDSIRISRDVGSYEVYDDGRIFYTAKNPEPDPQGIYTASLYSSDLKALDSKTKLASNVFSLISALDPENIIYTKKENNNTDTLYAVGLDRNEEKLSEDIRSLFYDPGSGKYYFAATSRRTLNLYDYVEDTTAQSDAQIPEPTLEEYTGPNFIYQMVEGYDLYEEDLGALFTTCTKKLYWYGMSSWNCYSMEEALNKTWTNNEHVHRETKAFIDTFGSRADEDGYIYVDEDVRAALKRIHRYAEEPEQQWQWLWLCYHRYQHGETVDYDAYNAAYDIWDAAQRRISMREALQKEENAFPLSTLYCYDHGELIAISENVTDFSSSSGGVMFSTADMVTGTVSIEDVTSILDVASIFTLDKEAENQVLLKDGTICQMSLAAAETYAAACEQQTVHLYFTSDQVFMQEPSGVLSVAAIKDGMVTDFSLITDDGKLLEAGEDILYYSSNAYTIDARSYWDLYSYKDGESTLLARDVMSWNSTLYEDGVICAYTGHRDYYGYELTLIDSKGETTFISDNVMHYVRVDKSTLLYISDGDLYCYNGEERKMIQEQVQWFWSSAEMEAEHTF